VGKRRFGVAIDSKISLDLDIIVKSLGLDRSKIVEIALKNYISEYKHLLSKHICRGIIVIENANEVSIDKILENHRNILENHRNIITNYIHSHIDKECICVIFVSGDSENINALNQQLLSCGCLVRYLPFHHN
jgi:CopG family nickel-responsive transcriptional regulator